MKQNNVIQIKSYTFALKIVDLYKKIAFEKREYVLSKQILRSGTSIGANIEEAIGAQSRKDFIARLSISYRESRETLYWLRILKDSELIDKNIAESLQNDCEELIRIISKILQTMKQKSPITNS